jgi:hypothetical protein
MWRQLLACATLMLLPTATVAQSQLVNLIPFDVSIALADDSVPIDVVTLTSLVAGWMTGYIATVTEADGLYSFDQVLLETQDSNRRSLRGLSTNFIATYKGVTIWKRDKPIPDETVVAGYQLTALLAAREQLKAIFIQEATSTGLGSSVVDVRASINPNVSTAPAGNSTSSNNSKSLDIVIVVAITIAGLAFLLLGFALFMAWKGNRDRAGNYRVGTKGAGTAEEESYDEKPVQKIPSPPPSEIGATPGGGACESVISEDISTSLSAYYKSGVNGGAFKDKQQAGYLNDAASVSSMESYGYSLDGYASSIGGPSLKMGK